MCSTNRVLATTTGAVAHLLLNKPAKLNALDEEMLLELDRQFSEWECNPEIAVVVLGSTTGRAFCVGADIEGLANMNKRSMQAWELLGARVLDRIQSSPLISMASIAGHTLGGGLTLAAACDFRIAAVGATFGQPEIDLGWVPGWDGVVRLGNLIGIARAKQLCMTARRITVTEAEAIGLVDVVSEAAELKSATDALADTLAGKSREALQGIKALSGGSASHLGVVRFDALLNAALLNNERAQAAIAEFLAKKR